MPKPCKFPSLDSCQKRFLWNHKEVDLTPHPVISFVLQVGDTEKSVYALDLNSLPFFRVSNHSPCFTATEENGGDKRLVELELVCEADGVAPPNNITKHNIYLIHPDGKLKVVVPSHSKAQPKIESYIHSILKYCLVWPLLPVLR